MNPLDGSGETPNKPPSTDFTKLDTILAHAFNLGWDRQSFNLKPNKQAIKQLILDLIGADLAHYRTKFPPHCPYFEHLEEADCTCGIVRANLEKEELRDAVEAL